MPLQMSGGAEFSPDRRYRYVLWRTWNVEKPYAVFIGLNPSTADETADDPTVRRCIGFAKSWGYGGLRMLNLFAYRTPRPSELLSVSDPVGPDNDRWISKAAADERSGVVVAAWGNLGGVQARADAVKKLIPAMCFLKLNISGHPAHPLYLRGDLKPTPWRSDERSA